MRLLLACWIVVVATVGRGALAGDLPAIGERILTGWTGGTAEEVVVAGAKIGARELVLHHDNATNFTRVIVNDARRYHPHAEGAALLGYDAKWGKSAAQVRAELQTILDAGCRRVQICDLRAVLRNPDVAAVVAEYFAHSPD